MRVWVMYARTLFGPAALGAGGHLPSLLVWWDNGVCLWTKSGEGFVLIRKILVLSCVGLSMLLESAKVTGYTKKTC